MNQVEVVPHPAASVLMLREPVHGDSLEVFVQHRATTMDFAAGAVVFPGGRSEPGDDDYNIPGLDADRLAEHVEAWKLTTLAADDDQVARLRARAMLATAIREVFEETGSLLRCHDMQPWANLTTPPRYPKRFDVFFYVARHNPELTVANTTTEAVRADWQPIDELLAQADTGDIMLMLPTRMLLSEVLAINDLDRIMQRTGAITPVRNK